MSSQAHRDGGAPAESPDAGAQVEWFGAPGGEPVVLAGWSPGWERRYREWETRLRGVLGTGADRIDHIGSTAVPPLAAKPVIDVLVAVRDVTDEAGYRSAVESLGLELRAREPDHRFFRPPAGEPRSVHVHVCQTCSRWERDHLLFRDYLRAHPGVAADYGRLKQQLAREVGQDRGRYTGGKTKFVAATLRDAEVWARQVRWAP